MTEHENIHQHKDKMIENSAFVGGMNGPLFTNYNDNIYSTIV